MKNKICIALVAIFLVAMCLSSSGCIVKGTGTSTDTIYGSEYSGLVFKTHKVWLTNDHGLMGGKDEATFDGTYTVKNNDEEIIQKLEEAKNEGWEVKITYEEHLFGEPWNFHGTTVITGVEKTEK